MPLVLDDHIVLLTGWNLKTVVVQLYIFDAPTQNL